jgi:hypothetical protein
LNPETSRGLMAKFIDLKGKRFGTVRVLRKAHLYKNHWHWFTKCDCGQRSIVLGYMITSRRYSACRLCRLSQRGLTTTHSREYGSWGAMQQRCFNKNCDDYKSYGGRGITVCDEWRGENGFVNFLNDMGRRPKGKTLDRENVEGNYCPKNCRWANSQTQAENRRCNYTEEQLADLREQASEAESDFGRNL